MSLNQQQLENLKRLLRDRQLELQNTVKEVLARTGEEASFGQITDVPDVGDLSVAELMTDLDNSALHRAVAELREIDAAFERMDEGSYGQCVDCGLAIDYRRLEASPTARRCLACQDLYERTHANNASPTL